MCRDNLSHDNEDRGIRIYMSAIRQVFSTAILMLCISLPVAAQESASDKALKALNDFFKFDVPYIPTPPEVAHAMLRLADTGPDDVVYDLGSGDGRIVITAARDFGVKKGVGIDLDQDLIARAIETAKKEGLDDRTDFLVADIFATDFTDATVLTLYLLEKINVRLRPRILNELAPGTRVVSHYFNMGDWVPDAKRTEQQRRIYMWIVPANVGGTWSWAVDGQDYRLELTQKYQDVSGAMHTPDGGAELSEIKMRGAILSFETSLRSGETIIPITFEGEAAGNFINAKVAVNGKSRAISAIRTP
jgi:SAM-dependent methyltransferase